MATVSWKSIGKHNSFELEDEDDPETKDDFDTFRKWLEEQESWWNSPAPIRDISWCKPWALMWQVPQDDQRM